DVPGLIQSPMSLGSDDRGFDSGGALSFTLIPLLLPPADGASSRSPLLNCVHGPAFMSRNIGACHAYSGCCARKSFAMKSAPQGCPARATSCIFPAMLLSVALPCTAPPG